MLNFIICGMSVLSLDGIVVYPRLPTPRAIAVCQVAGTM